MQINRLMHWIPRGVQIAALSLFLFTAGSNPVLAYGGKFHHGGHHHKHHGHHDYAGLGYIFLGVAGLLVLSSYLNRPHYNQGVYQRVYSPPPPRYYPPQTRVYQVPAPAPVTQPPLPAYSENAGWDALARGDEQQAMDIFAVQSQQNLDSGIPRVGFSLAAAANGELTRAVRSMQKAVLTDPEALRDISLDRQLRERIAGLVKIYENGFAAGVDEADSAFMVAALSFLNHDYRLAGEAIATNDNRESTILLRRMIQDELVFRNQ